MTKKSMSMVHLPLTDAQLRSLAKGKAVSMKGGAMCGKGTDCGCGLYLSANTARRVARAKRLGKGVKISLSPEEMKENEVEIEGGRINFGKLGKTLRSTAKAVGRFYRKEIRPEIAQPLRRLVKRGIEKGLPAAATAVSTLLGVPEVGIAAQPYVQRLAKDISEPITEGVSKLTGAYGLYSGNGLMAGGAVGMKCPSGHAQLQSNYSNFLNPNHPAWNPLLPVKDMSATVGAGLYATSNASTGRGCFMTGGPMNPLLPEADMSGFRAGPPTAFFNTQQ